MKSIRTNLGVKSTPRRRHHDPVAGTNYSYLSCSGCRLEKARCHVVHAPKIISGHSSADTRRDTSRLWDHLPKHKHLYCVRDVVFWGGFASEVFASCISMVFSLLLC